MLFQICFLHLGLNAKSSTYHSHSWNIKFSLRKWLCLLVMDDTFSRIPFYSLIWNFYFRPVILPNIDKFTLYVYLSVILSKSSYGKLASCFENISKRTGEKNTKLSILKTSMVLKNLDTEYFKNLMGLKKVFFCFQLFLPLVENDEITESMRVDVEEDPVSEFVVHCRANFVLPSWTLFWSNSNKFRSILVMCFFIEFELILIDLHEHFFSSNSNKYWSTFVNSFLSNSS